MRRVMFLSLSKEAIGTIIGGLITLISVIKTVWNTYRYKDVENYIYKVVSKHLNKIRILEAAPLLARLSRKLARMLSLIFKDGEISARELELLKNIETTIDGYVEALNANHISLPKIQ